ncbi:MAG: hypothetical protein K0S47_4357 [Herbinix sp.]|jgi:transcriptional regulator with XRE-family HTH domain|nr:hypothetical protein [Herbinix sp.]
MEIGEKIKSLRLNRGITQEVLADELGVTYQAVSKWENNVTMPDIQLLPKLSIYFGVTIDELFELTSEDRLHRIENMLDNERSLSSKMFEDTVNFLKEQLEKDRKNGRIYAFLAKLYLHRIHSDGEIAAEYGKCSLRYKPEAKDCHEVFQRTSNGVICDWNAGNCHELINFYYELVENNPNIARNYLYLMDNLIGDRRIEEARNILKGYAKLEDHKDYLCVVYDAFLLEADGLLDEAECCWNHLIEKFPDQHLAWFSIADHRAKHCRYEEAIEYYEKAFELSPKPRYYDPLQAIAHIYEIQRKYDQAADTWKRIIEVLNREFDIHFGEVVDFPRREYERLKQSRAKEKS